MFRFSFYPLFGSYGIVLGIVVLLAAVLLLRRPDDERLTDRGRRFLIGLRFLSLAILLFAMLRPTLVYTKTDRLKSTLNILLDDSESMSRPDEIGGNSRYDIARESILNAQPQIKKLQELSEVNFFTFDSTLHPIPLQVGIPEKLPEKPLGKETALGANLDTIRERSTGKRLLGVVLLSDGTQRTRPPRDILPQDAAARLRDAGFPLYTVRLGQPSGTVDIQDIAVNDLQANDRVFVKNELIISGSIRISGFRNQPIPVQLLFEDLNGKMQQVAETTVRSSEDGQIVPYRISYAPQRTGYFKYTVQVPAQPKELIDTNNVQSNFVRVIDGGLTVLFIQGERNYEQRPLKYSLDASADIHVDYRALRVGRIASSGNNSETSESSQTFQARLEKFTKERASWTNDMFSPGKYNVYILDDIDSKAFKPEELNALAERVREGSGLIMLGGLHAFGAGGYANTPLADVCPVELRGIDSQPFDAPIRKDIHWPGPISIAPTEYGATHYVLRLDPNPTQNRTRWAQLPPLVGANRFGKIKGGATILATGPQDQPIFVTQLFGLGRVLAFAGDSTYRWSLEGFSEEHKRFWRQVVLWLAKMDGPTEGDCWITLDNVRLLPGETAKFHVFLQSPEGEEIKNFKAEADVLKPDGTKEKIPLVDEDGTQTGSFRGTDQPGDYTIQVETTHETTLRLASARFMVFDRNLELDNPVAYPKLLENMSTTTGGRSIPPEQLGSLLDELIKKSNGFIEKRETKQALYDSWGLLIPFILALSLEWFARKRWGMV